MDNLDKKAIGQRLKEFAIKKYGKIEPLAEKLGMGYASFHGTYIGGRSLPGAKIISKLITLGCDIEWLLHGEVDQFKVCEGTKIPLSHNIEIDRLKKENENLKEKLNQIQKLIK